MAVDIGHLEALESEFGAKVNRAARRLTGCSASRSTSARPSSCRWCCSTSLRMPKTRRTRTGYTTDAEALQQLYVKTEHPFLAQMLMHRDAIRLKQTVEGLLKSVADDGRIHTTYVQTIAATGRLSSTDPNLQNIPIRTEEGRRIREAFVVGPGYDALMSADYSQIEMRIMAHASEDDSLIEAFKSGMDFHTVTASRVFGVEPTKVSPGERAKIKAMNYGLAYGLSAYGLSQQLTIEVSEAKALMDEYFERFGGVRDYLRSLVVDARRTEYTETILGRRRYLPDLMSDNRQRREMAERMALNAPIQGSAADIIKVAMLDVEKALDDAGECGAGCCCRSTTSWSSRSDPASGRRWSSWSGTRWATPSTSTCRWTSRWASGAPGTTRLTAACAEGVRPVRWLGLPSRGPGRVVRFDPVHARRITWHVAVACATSDGVGHARTGRVGQSCGCRAVVELLRGVRIGPQHTITHHPSRSPTPHDVLSRGTTSGRNRRPRLARSISRGHRRNDQVFQRRRYRHRHRGQGRP